METTGEISLSSFLAGALLKKNSISYFELLNGSSFFEDTTNYSIFDDAFEKLLDIISDDGYSEMYLKYNYNDLYDGISVKEYLYSLTNDEVRKFFQINEIENSSTPMKTCRIFNLIKTRVF